MKNILSALLLFVLPALLVAQSENYTDSKGFKQGHWEYIERDTTEKYVIHVRHSESDTMHLDTGFGKNAAEKTYQVTHKCIAGGNYTDDRKNGVWILYQDNAGIDPQMSRTEVTENNGKVIQYMHMFHRKIKKYEITFKNGVKNGPLKTYNAQGNLISEMHFTRDEPSSELTTYYENGQRMFIGKLNEKTGYYEGMEFYKTGSKRGSKKIHVDYVMDNFSDTREIAKILSTADTVN